MPQSPIGIAGSPIVVPGVSDPTVMRSPCTGGSMESVQGIATEEGNKQDGAEKAQLIHLAE